GWQARRSRPGWLGGSALASPHAKNKLDRSFCQGPRSLAPERGDGIGARGAPRGEPAREVGGQDEERGNDRVGYGIGGLDAEEQRAEHAAESQGGVETKGNARASDN